MATTGRAAFIVLALAVAMLAGCVPTQPMPTPTDTKSSSPSPTPTAAPKLDPEGTAEDNFPFWQGLMEAIDTSNAAVVDGALLVQVLVDNGFNKADMEVTPTYTAIGELADSTIVSVRFKGECLIGQIFVDHWAATRAPILGTGTCLVGTTRPIDF